MLGFLSSIVEKSQQAGVKNFLFIAIKNGNSNLDKKAFLKKLFCLMLEVLCCIVETQKLC